MRIIDVHCKHFKGNRFNNNNIKIPSPPPWDNHCWDPSAMLPNCKVHTNLWKHRFWAFLPEIWIPRVWTGAWEWAFYLPPSRCRCSQFWGPRFEKLYPNHAMPGHLHSLIFHSLKCVRNVFQVLTCLFQNHFERLCGMACYWNSCQCVPGGLTGVYRHWKGLIDQFPF